MQTQRYFIIGDFFCHTDPLTGQPEENQILALIDDLTPEEADLIARAVTKAAIDAGDHIEARCVSESQSQEDMAAHLVRCAKAAEIAEALRKRPANDSDLYFRTARCALRCAEEARKLRPDGISEHAHQRFEVIDSEQNMCVPFDATGAQSWGPVDESKTWFSEGELRHELTLYRHPSGHWTLLTESYHVLFDRLVSPPEARRLSDEEAVEWLLRHGYEPPSDVAHLSVNSFFKPGPPSPTPNEPAQPADEEAEAVRKATVEPPEDKAGAPIDTRFVVSLSPPQVTIDGTAYALNDKAAQLLDGLMKSRDWVSASSIVNQSTRVANSMPTQVRQWIERSPGKGFRVRAPE